MVIGLSSRFVGKGDLFSCRGGVGCGEVVHWRLYLNLRMKFYHHFCHKYCYLWRIYELCTSIFFCKKCLLCIGVLSVMVDIVFVYGDE